MPFHPDSTDLPLGNLAAGSSAIRKIRRSVEAHLAEAIGGKEVISASQVFADYGLDGTFVVAGRRRRAQRAVLEPRIIGVAQIAHEVPGASQWVLIAEPRCLGGCTREETRTGGSIFFVARDHRRMSESVA